MPTDVLVWGVDKSDSLPTLSKRVLRFDPDMLIVALAKDVRQGKLWRIKFCSTPMGEVFPNKIVETILAQYLATN